MDEHQLRGMDKIATPRCLAVFDSDAVGLGAGVAE